MSFSVIQVEEANKECRYLHSRGSKGPLNPDFGGNPDCKPQVAGYMGIPKIGWIAIIGVLGYFAYTKGMFK